MKMYSLLLAIPLLCAACSSDNDSPIDPSTIQPTQPATTLISDLSLHLSTDKARYAPGEKVSFTSGSPLPDGAKVRYRQGATVIEEQSLTGTSWTWTPPSTDYTGYLADVYTTDASGKQTICGTIAIDVSSDWARYPRYGFVGTYDDTKTSEVISQETALLNRCHINGLQFYDWQNKHHEPVVLRDGKVEDSYADIANRKVNTSVVKAYISQAHAHGMKAMFYDLCYGALDDAVQDGVSPKWYMYKDESHSTVDALTLPSGWKSNITLVNPGNTAWQDYFARKVSDVYKTFDFDGFHIDQVGNRDPEYDYYGSKINVTQGFASFIAKMKKSDPAKRLVMNAVSNYGAKQMAATGDVDFLYSELWGGEDQFADLFSIMRNNQSEANTDPAAPAMAQVFAAYMNYNKESGTFNTPGVLLTDAVMFAIGASHLELGDHMLHKEYFPNSDLKMDGQLDKAIVHYYDFLTAYENLLRDRGTDLSIPVVANSSEVTINSWPPRLQTVTTVCREVNGKKIISLLNFSQANSLSWRDMDGTQPEPKALSNIPLAVKTKDVKKVWVASPDALGGVAQELPFQQKGDYITFTLPSLKYWTMVVME
jgi:dextranase